MTSIHSRILFKFEHRWAWMLSFKAPKGEALLYVRLGQSFHEPILDHRPQGNKTFGMWIVQGGGG